MEKESPGRGQERTTKMGIDRVRSAKIISLIETVVVVGNGTEQDPSRYLYQYWNDEGELIAQTDPVIDKGCKYSAF